MRHGRTAITAICTILGALGSPGCDESPRGGAGADSDADGDGGADGGSDAGSDTDADGGAGCTDLNYPPGPYDWLLEEVVPDTAFPAIFADVSGQLVLGELFCTEVESLVFVLGADD